MRVARVRPRELWTRRVVMRILSVVLGPGPPAERSQVRQCRPAVARRSNNFESRSIQFDATYRADLRDSGEGGATGRADDHAPTDDVYLAKVRRIHAVQAHARVIDIVPLILERRLAILTDPPDRPLMAALRGGDLHGAPVATDTALRAGSCVAAIFAEWDPKVRPTGERSPTARRSTEPTFPIFGRNFTLVLPLVRAGSFTGTCEPSCLRSRKSSAAAIDRDTAVPPR
jgi:hypothetical protein